MASTSGYKVILDAVLNTTTIAAQIKSLEKSAKFTINTSSVDKSSKSMNTFAESTEKAEKSAENLKTGTETVATNVANMGNSATKASGKLKGMASSFTTILGKVAKFGAATALIGAFTSAVYASAKTVKDYDDAMTQFKKVSDLTGDSLTKYGVKLGKMGQSVAKSRIEMINSATEYKKSGYSDKDAATLAKVSSMYQNIADEELSASDASSVIISQMKAFNISASNSTHIIDAINEVSNNFAVSSGDIGQGLTAAGAALSTYGNTFEETIGLVTSGTEIFHGQSQKVARGLNTIASRIAKNSSTLKEYGVNVNDSNGNLRSTYDILGDLKPKWDKMTNSQKVSLGNTLAGVNQYKVFAAVMNNYSKAQEATTTALNSSGSAEKENKKQLESLSGRITECKAAAQELVLGNGGIVDVAKWFIIAGTDILKFADSDVGKAIIKLTAFSGIVLGVSRAIGKITKSVAAVQTAIGSTGFLSWLVNGKSTKNVENIGEEVSNAAKKATTGLTEVEKGATLAGEGIEAGTALSLASLSSLLPIIGAVAAALGAIALISWWSNKPERDYKNASKNLTGLKKKYKSVQEEIDKLKHKASHGGLTDVEKNRLKILEAQTKEIKKQISLESSKKLTASEEKFKYSYTASSYDASGTKKTGTYTATQTGTSAITAATKALSKLSDTYGKTGKKQKEFIDFNSKNIKGLESLNKKYSSASKLTTEQQKNYKKVKTALEKYAAAGGKVTGLTKKEKKEVDKIAKSYSNYAKKYALTTSKLKTLSNITSKTAIPTFKKLGKSIGVSVNKGGKLGKINVTKFAKSMKEAGYNSEETQGYLTQVLDAGGKVNDIDISTFEANMKKAGFSANDVLDYLKLISASNPNAKITLDGSKVAISDLKVINGKLKVVDDAKPTPKIKIDKTAFVSGLHAVLDGLQGIPSTKTINITTKTKHNAKGTQYSDEELAVVNDNPSGGSANGKYPEIIKRAKTGKMFIANNGEEGLVQLHTGDKVYTAQQSKSIINSLPHYAKGKSASSQFSSLEHHHNMGTLSDEQYYKKLTKLNNKYYKNSKKHLDDYRSNLEAVYSYEEDKYKDVVEDKISALKTESGATEANFKTTLAYIKKLRKQGKISKDTYTDLIKEYYEAKADQIVKDYTNEKMSYAASLTLLKKYLKESKISYEDYYNAIDDLNDAQLEKEQNQANVKEDILNWYAEQQQKIIENQITELNNEKDALEAAKDEEDAAKELAELEQNLIDAENTKIRVFKDGEWQYVSDANAVKTAQTALNDYKNDQAYDKEIDNIDNQIDALQDESDAWSDYVDKYEALQTKLENEQTLGMTYEKYILDNRITNIQSFADAYEKVVNEIVDLAAKANSAISSVTTVTISTTSTKSTSSTKKKKKSTKGYASGSDDVEDSGVYNFNELGDELLIPANVNYASKGSGVIPHTMSENLKEIGMHTWSDITNEGSNYDNHSISIQSMTVKTDNAQDFLKQMKNLVNVNS